MITRPTSRFTIPLASTQPAPGLLVRRRVVYWNSCPTPASRPKKAATEASDAIMLPIPRGVVRAIQRVTTLSSVMAMPLARVQPLRLSQGRRAKAMIWAMP